MSAQPELRPEIATENTLHPDLVRWLGVATGDLPDDLRDDVQQEIINHYYFAREDALLAGQTPEDAHISAMIALGDTSLSREAMQTTYLSYRRYFKAGLVGLGTPLVYGVAWLGWDALNGWWLFVSELVIMVALVYMLITLKVLVKALFSFEPAPYREARWATIAFVCAGFFTAFWLVLVKHYGQTGMNRPTVRALWLTAMGLQTAMGVTSIWIGMRVLHLKSGFSVSMALGYAHILVGGLLIISVIINVIFRNFLLFRQVEIFSEILFMIVFTLWGVLYLQATRQGRYVLG